MLTRSRTPSRGKWIHFGKSLEARCTSGSSKPHRKSCTVWCTKGCASRYEDSVANARLVKMEELCNEEANPCGEENYAFKNLKESTDFYTPKFWKQKIIRVFKFYFTILLQRK